MIDLKKIRGSKYLKKKREISKYRLRIRTTFMQTSQDITENNEETFE